MKSFHPVARAVSVIVLLATAAACTDTEGSAPSAPAMPPTSVSVVEVKAEELPVVNELPGRIAPTRIAEVRPRISGIVVERVFEQGSVVKPGDVLYRIDADLFRVQVQSAEATLKRAEATQVLARQQAERQDQLRKRNIASVQEQDSAVAALAQADADVASAQAGLATAKLNLAYTEVTAPIGGRIGRALITEGALVSSAESLATIQQLDPIYADFTQPAADLIRLRKALQEGQLADSNEAPVYLLFDDGSRYPHPGRLLFSEAAVDASTGQVTLRGEFPNPDGSLLPGMYVRIQIEQGIEQGALAIPQQAVQRDASGQSNVMVVGGENKVETRRIVVGRTIGNRFVVASGLNEGDRVVVEGFQKIGPGATVNPQPWMGEAAEPGAQTGSTPAAEQAAADKPAGEADVTSQ
jgi:membrane fusion protein (multidrug efflux system)